MKEFNKTFDYNLYDKYFHYGLSGRIRFCRLILYKGIYYTNCELQIRATTLDLYKLEELVDYFVEYNNVAGLLRSQVLHDNFNEFIAVQWLQGQKLQDHYVWNNINNLSMIDDLSPKLPKQLR